MPRVNHTGKAKTPNVSGTKTAKKVNKRRTPDAPTEHGNKRAKTTTPFNTSSKALTRNGSSNPLTDTSAKIKKPIQKVSCNNARPTRKLHVYVFGEGSAGELGLGNKNAIEVSTPRINPSLSDVVCVATGGMHGAALTSNNRVLTWGVNDHASLGRDTTWDGGLRDVAEGEESGSEDGDLNPLEATPTAIPVDSFPPGTEIVQVAAGDSATFVLTGDGLVYGCGTFRDMNGVFGFSIDPRNREVVKIQATFDQVPNLKNIKSLSVGADFALALDINGHVFAWGSGQQHQLGRRIVERRRVEALIPARVEIPKTRKMASIHAGIDHAFAIDVNGDTWTWGLNNYAQTGITDDAGEGEASVCAPRKVPSLVGKQMKMIHSGRHHSIGVTTAGECLVWGRMDGGQMGLSLSELSSQPQDSNEILVDSQGRPRVLLKPTFLPIGNCIFAAAGTDHCIAITSDGKAWSWGFNVNYQCGQGTSDDILVAKPIDRKSIRDVKFCWAGAGGQYSMLAAFQGGNE